jgi:Tfp pilus assembly protein PilF
MHTNFFVQMNNERIQQLLQFIQNEPDEPFNVYALAMEYLSTNPAQAQHYFEKLLNEHPQYLPTYYHAAQLYANIGDRTKASMYYDFGMQLARQQNNQKTFDELQRAYRTFQDDEE